MKRPSLPYLETRLKNGKTYWYFRRKPGKPVRLPDPADDAFLIEYKKAKEGRAPMPGRTSIAALVQSYKVHGNYSTRGKRTREDYDAALAHIVRVAGERDVSAITMPGVVRAMEDNNARIRFANYLGQLYNILCKHAVKIGWTKSNPLVGLELLPVPKEKRRPHIPWPDWAVETFRAEAAPMALLAFEIGVGTCQRAEDLTRFRWSDYDGENMRIRSSKTDVDGIIPCTPQLKAALDRAEKKGLTILTNRRGQPWSYAALATVMYAERKRLGLSAYDNHGMRYRGIMELAWAGCDDDEIASFSLHVSKAMIVKYAGQARQIMRARAAGTKRTEQARNKNGQTSGQTR
jgi:integrase